MVYSGRHLPGESTGSDRMPMSSSPCRPGAGRRKTRTGGPIESAGGGRRRTKQQGIPRRNGHTRTGSRKTIVNTCRRPSPVTPSRTGPDADPDAGNVDDRVQNGFSSRARQRRSTSLIAVLGRLLEVPRSGPPPRLDRGSEDGSVADSPSCDLKHACGQADSSHMAHHEPHESNSLRSSRPTRSRRAMHRGKSGRTLIIDGDGGLVVAASAASLPG